MAIDLNRFIATFFDEAQEHLESIEEMAMLLGSGADDAETLNTIFRAAHSIKGGSGTFGFTQLAEATHEMETLFDALRKGQGRADESTVRLLLDACDVFKAHLAKLKAGERANDTAMDGVRAQFVASRAKTFGDAAIAAEPVAPASAAPVTESFFAAAEKTREGESYGLFEPEPAAAPAAGAPEKYGLFEEPAAVPAEQNRRKGD